MSPGSSSVPTRAVIVAVTAAIMAVMMVGPAIATTIAGIVVAVLMVLGAYWWGGCSVCGVLTKSRKLELGLSSE